MADFSRVTPTGWSQGDDASDAARVTPTGWEQINAVATGGAQTLYWVVAPTALADYTDDDTSAGYIRNGQDDTGSALAAGSYGSIASPTTPGANVVDAAAAATGLTPGTAYRIAWTIWDGVNYGGGTATKVVESASFTTINIPVFIYHYLHHLGSMSN